MPTIRLRSLLFFFFSAGLAFSSCTEKEDSEPQKITATSQQLTAGSWRLEEINQNGKVTSSGANIKDRYSLSFRADGTYTQTLLADNSTYVGTWMLMNDNSVLHYTDHKGAKSEYKLTGVKPNELRYSYTNKTNQQEELVFSAQP